MKHWCEHMNNEKYCLVTILDTVSETSMPLNEFVLYRLKKYPNIRQCVIVCDRKENTRMCLPDDLDIYYAEGKWKLLKNVFKQINNECINENEKVIVHLHQLKSAMLFYRAALGIKKTYQVLFSVHSVYALRNMKYKISSTFCSLFADRTVCVSEASYRTYSPAAKLIKGKKIFAIQNGVDVERIDQIIDDTEENCTAKNEEKVLVYVGRLIPIKNQKFLVEMFRKFSDCKLIFVGAEDTNKEISRLVQKLGLEEKIKITGMVSRSEVFRILSQADIYLSSSTVEGLPVSVLEAMAAEIPVILSDIEPHREIAEKSEFVKLLSLSKEDEWVDTVNNYLKLDSKELKKIGSECRKCAVDYFSLSKMHSNYDKVYADLLQR